MPDLLGVRKRAAALANRIHPIAYEGYSPHGVIPYSGAFASACAKSLCGMAIRPTCAIGLGSIGHCRPARIHAPVVRDVFPVVDEPFAACAERS